MARKSRFEGYTNYMKGRAAKPALSVKRGSIKERLAFMKEISKETSKGKEKK